MNTKIYEDCDQAVWKMLHSDEIIDTHLLEKMLLGQYDAASLKGALSGSIKSVLSYTSWNPLTGWSNNNMPCDWFRIKIVRKQQFALLAFQYSINLNEPSK